MLTREDGCETMLDVRELCDRISEKDDGLKKEREGGREGEGGHQGQRWVESSLSRSEERSRLLSSSRIGEGAHLMFGERDGHVERKLKEWELVV